MNTSKVRMMDQKTKNIVSGYIRKITSNYKHLNIPSPIIDIIIIFYYIYTFNKNCHGRNIEFIGDTLVKSTRSGWKTCLFGDEFTNKLCNKINIEIKWKEMNDSFFIGFITSSINESIKNWDQRLGYGANQQNSVGFFVTKTRNHITINDENNFDGKISDYAAPNNFCNGDTFELEIDFPKNTVSIYHNKTIVGTRSLNTNQITLAFSFYWNGEVIEILKCVSS